MITPRQRGTGDKGKFVYENGKWIQQDMSLSEKVEQTSTAQNPNVNDMLKRHKELITRQRRAGM
jgi:hypothetical protein